MDKSRFIQLPEMSTLEVVRKKYFNGKAAILAMDFEVVSP